MISASEDMKIIIWRINNEKIQRKKLLKILNGHDGWVFCLAIHKNDKFFASGSKDRKIKIWSNMTGKNIRTLIAHADDV